MRLADLRAYLEDLNADDLFAGRYWGVGHVGNLGAQEHHPQRLRRMGDDIASYGRTNEWAAIRSGLTHRVSMAVVSSTAAWHQSSRVAATVRSPFIASERLDAASPLPDIVARLNQLRPDVLVAYASMMPRNRQDPWIECVRARIG